MLERAEGRLQGDKDRIADTVKSREYVGVKRGIRVVGSFGMGLAIEAGGRLGVLDGVEGRLPGRGETLSR